MTGNSPAKYKYVYFDLPFVLFLKDNMSDPDLKRWVEATKKGEPPPYSRYAPSKDKPSQLILGAGIPVYIPPDELAPIYIISYEGLEVGMRCLRRVNPHRQTILVGELEGDRTGRVSFSSIQFTFDLRKISKEYYYDAEFFVQYSIRAVNWFLDHYRVITDRPYIGSVTKQGIQEFHLVTEFEDGTKTQFELGSGSGPLRGFGGAIPDDQDQELRNAITKENKPEITNVLDSNVRNYLDLHEWRLALLEVGIFFEFFVTRFVRQKYSDAGMTSADIDKRFLTAKGYPKGVTSIAKELVLDATKFDFSASPQYSDWQTSIRDPRNDIAHGKRFEVTQIEAENAYQILKNAIKLFKTI